MLVKTQWNARVHLLATSLVIAAAMWWGVADWEWCALALSIALVWAAEAFNTAVETIVDLLSPELHPLAGRAKDLAAGGVLAAAIGAAAVGGIIFAPRVLALCGC